jgi:hypothetical protein
MGLFFKLKFDVFNFPLIRVKFVSKELFLKNPASKASTFLVSKMKQFDILIYLFFVVN